MAKDDWRDGGRLIKPGQGGGSSSSSFGSSRGGGRSSPGGASKGGGTTSSRPPSRSSGSNRGWNPGDIYTERGKQYIRSSTGMGVPLDSDAGRRVQNQYGSRGGSSGGYNQKTRVLSDYIGPSGGAAGGLGQPNPNDAMGVKASDYLKSNYTPGSAYTSDPWAGKAVGRLRNGMMVDRDYLEKHPDVDVYPLTYKPHNYKSTVDEFGNVYNHLGQKWGTGGVWTYDELPDYAKAKYDWNYGVSPGYSYPKSDAYNDAYNWYNSTYGVAADDTHPLSQGKKPGGGSYWAAGGTGVGGPEYRPNQLYYSAPDGNGGYSQVLPGMAAQAAAAAGALGGAVPAVTGLAALSGTKAIPSTGIYGGGGMDYMREYQNALESAENESARAYRKQIEAAIDAINAQRDPLRQQYEQGAQQAYIEAERAKKQLPEALAAQGINGGATESANLAIETNRGNSLNDLTNTYNNALAGLEQTIAQARSSGDIQLANIASQYQQMLANAILSAQQQQQQYAQQMAMMNYQNQLDLDSYEKQLQLQNKYKTPSGGSTSSRLVSTLLDMNEQGYENMEYGFDQYTRNAALILQGGNPFENNGNNTPGYVPTTQSAPSLYNTDWMPGGKAAYVNALKARGLTASQIADELNRLGIR